MSQPENRVAVVTGGNRGIGFEICRQLARRGLTVVLTSRDEDAGREACRRLEGEGSVRYHRLDVVRPEDIRALAGFLEGEFGRCDVLVNNAGIFPDAPHAGVETLPSVLETRVETIERAMRTNVYGPLSLCQALVPLMRRRGYGRIVNVSSGMGRLTDMNGGFAAYRISKTALNALTRILADELKTENILVNSMCPGWVRTDMGGPRAPRSPEEGADTAVWLATLPDDGPRGGFFRDRRSMVW